MADNNQENDVSEVVNTEETNPDLEAEENGETQMEGENVDTLEDEEAALQEDDNELAEENGDESRIEDEELEESTEAGPEEGGEGEEEGREGEEEEEGKEGAEEEHEEEEEEEEVEAGKPKPSSSFDPNVMPQVNVQTLAKRRWQVKVYPLKPSDFTSGSISRVFRDAKESLLYLISAGKASRGKGEMYITSVNNTLRVVQGLMKRDSYFQDVNIEIVKKNDEGVVEEKAYMRFDSKLIRMLFMPPDHSFSWGAQGRKRERIIGSVFVKNLPASTSKDMLRVMFPFAQEINYNPEKFKEGTARLVLKSRNAVIPCLKAFVKVELGGQTLELHPLDKKRNAPRKPGESSRKRSRSKSPQGDDKESEEKKPKEDSTNAEEDGDEEGKGDDAEKAETSGKKPADRRKSEGGSSSKKPSSKKPEEGGDGKERRDRKEGDRPRKSFRPEGRGGRGGFRGSRGMSSGYRGGRGSYGLRGRRGGMRGAGDRRHGSIRDDVSRKDTNDMLVLQNQLSMAIKSQLAMLNQTKVAVAQAKMEAASSSYGGSRGADMSAGYDRRRNSGGYGQKRRAMQGERGGYGKRKGAGGYSDMYSRAVAEEDYRREQLYRAEESRASRAYGLDSGSGYGSYADDYYY